jgi:phospholipid/cholesterol/gamma-HCH transport system permease protein
MIGGKLAYVGGGVIDQIEGMGRFTRFMGSTWAWFFRGMLIVRRWTLLLPQLYQIGTKSIPVVMAVGAFMGMVLGVEAYDQFAAIGQEARLGGVINISVVKQVGPVLAAVMIAGRVGGSVSAELGTMRVTEQLDALRVMGTDPIAFLVVPRVLACIVMLPLLTIFSDLLGMAGGYFVTVYGYGVNSAAYWDFSARFVAPWDVFTGLFKSIVFGLMIGLISCYKGFHCKPGAEGVGRAATDAFVTSFLAIIASNLFLAKFFKDLSFVIFGHSSMSAFSG